MTRIALELIFVFIVALITSKFSTIPFLTLSALYYTIVQVVTLLNSFGKKIPFKELIVSIMAIQMLLSPFLEYHYYKFKEIGGMAVDEIEYFNYALPCNILIQIGMEIFYPKKILGRELFEIFSRRSGTIEKHGLILIAVGYFGYLIGEIAPVMRSFDFILYLLSFGRFIGFLYLWFSGSKFTIPAFILVIIPFTIEAVNSTILVELIVYSMILITVYFMKHESSRLKIYLVFAIAFFVLIAVQSVKYEYRKTVSKESFSGNRFLVLAESVVSQIRNYKDLDIKKLGGGVNVRINQGWILSDVLKHFKGREHDIQPKYFWREVKGVLLPRFIYPDKPVVGDHTKFHDFTGNRLNKRVAMTVGVMGDGYGNFGRVGGMLYCLGFGVLLGLILRIWYKLSWKYPTLILWGVLIFFYSMRAGDETYTVVNWIIKSSFLVLLYFILFERHLKMSYFFPVRIKAT